MADDTLNDTVETLLYSTLSDIVTECVPGRYLGGKAEYLEYWYYTVPYDFADDKPHVEVYKCFIGYYNRAGVSTLATRQAIKTALFNAGFTFPTEENNSEGDTQEYVFECAIANQVTV